MILYTFNTDSGLVIKFEWLTSLSELLIDYTMMLNYNNSAVIQWKTKPHSCDPCI
jgi:hypothetical protein